MKPQADDNWEAATWDGAELATLRAGARLTFRQKLKWLEDADRLAQTLQRARVRYPDPDRTGGWVIAEGRPTADETKPPTPTVDGHRKLQPDG